MMIRQLDKLNMVDGGDLRAYVNLIVDGMDREQLAAMEKSSAGLRRKNSRQNREPLEQHYKETFFTWLDRGKIVCEPPLPPAVGNPSHEQHGDLRKSLYEAEEDMNALEQDLVKRLTAIPNVLWWHRNIARHGFAINGYFNHYPDIMVMTKSGKNHPCRNQGRTPEKRRQSGKNRAGCGLAECSRKPVPILHGVPGRGKSATWSGEHGAVCGDNHGTVKSMFGIRSEEGKSSFMDNEYRAIDDLVRNHFANVVWTHKIQEKQAEVYEARYKLLATTNIVTASLNRRVCSRLFSLIRHG